MKKLLLITLLSLSLAAPLFAVADAGDAGGISNQNMTYVPLEPLPGGVNLYQTGSVNLGLLLNEILKILVIAGAFMAVGSMVFWGIMYMTSEVPGVKSNAKGRVTRVLWGMLLLLGAWLILYTINPQLLNFTNDFNPTPGGSGAVVPTTVPANAAPPPAAQLNRCPAGTDGAC